MSQRSSAPDMAEPPFLIKIFHRTGALPSRPEDFRRNPPPKHVGVYTWPDSTASHLALDLLGAELAGLVVGTRLVFQLVYADARGSPATPADAHFVARDLGSVVVGPNILTTEPVAMTLADAKFVVGDYISVAVLAPLPSGDVAPVAAAYRDGPRRENGYPKSLGRAPPRGPSGLPPRGSYPVGEWRRGEILPESPPEWRPRGRERW